MVIHDAPGMSNQDDMLTVTDLDTGETLTVTNDQEWVHFTIKTSAGTGEIEFLPDGTYLVAGRLGRLKEESRGAACSMAYRVLDTSPRADFRRSFAIVNSLVNAVDPE